MRRLIWLGLLVGPAFQPVLGKEDRLEAPSYEPGSAIRAKAGKSEIVITTTSRLAGAIHSLKWGGKEFIDSADHGRQLQSASNLDWGKEFIPEVFNLHFPLL